MTTTTTAPAPLLPLTSPVERLRALGCRIGWDDDHDAERGRYSAVVTLPPHLLPRQVLAAVPTEHHAAHVDSDGIRVGPWGGALNRVTVSLSNVPGRPADVNTAGRALVGILAAAVDTLPPAPPAPAVPPTEASVRAAFEHVPASELREGDVVVRVGAQPDDGGTVGLSLRTVAGPPVLLGEAVLVSMERDGRSTGQPHSMAAAGRVLVARPRPPRAED